MRAGNITALQGTARLQQCLPFHLYSAIFIGGGPVSARDGEGQSETGRVEKSGHTRVSDGTPPERENCSELQATHSLGNTCDPDRAQRYALPVQVRYKRPSRQAELCASQVVRRPRPGDGPWEARSHTYLTCEEVLLGQTHPISPESAW